MNKEGIKLLKELEGLKLKAYLCSAGIPTIGYGNTYYEDGAKVKIGDKISEERAEELLSLILKQYEDAVRIYTRSGLSENAMAALTSFAYNVGIGSFKSSTLLKVINSNGSNDEIKKQFMRWDKANGKVIKGLTIRRKKEYELFIK